MDMVLEVHAQYVAELKRQVACSSPFTTTELCGSSIWEKYKDEYARQRTKELRIL